MILPFGDTNQIIFSTQPLRADCGLCSHFNLDERHGDGDVGSFLHLDDALLSRACATPLPTETPDEQTINCSQSVRDAIGITRQQLFENKILNMDVGFVADEGPVVHDASEIITNV